MPFIGGIQELRPGKLLRSGPPVASYGPALLALPSRATWTEPPHPLWGKICTQPFTSVKAASSCQLQMVHALHDTGHA